MGALKTGKKLGDLLKEAGFIDDIQLTVALGMQRKTGLKVGTQLLKLGFVDEKRLSRVLRDQLGIRISLMDAAIPPEAVRAVPQDLAFRYRVMPVAFDGKSVAIAMEDPSDLRLVDELSFQLGARVRAVRALEWEIDGALIKYYLDFSDTEMRKLTTKSRAADQYELMQSSLSDMGSAASGAYYELESSGGEPLRVARTGPGPDGDEPQEKPEKIEWSEVKWSFGDAVEVAAASAPPPSEPQQQRPVQPGPPGSARRSLRDFARGQVRAQSAPPATPASAVPGAAAVSGAPGAPQPSPRIVRPGPPSPDGNRPKPPPPLEQKNKFIVQSALIDLLIKKGLISERELIDTLLRLEREAAEK